ncbi:CC/Se motif family (seleno)protein [Clostridium thermopalmarium]|uniref:FeS cluster biogenesis domain-containing protein n=1 Tax=Clostridium thermopalmarium DSM 5974 TaxID=1121340 RepID=A0A2T0AZI6_9CLOT|nr:CC/Se motif family (seleno)protein [Clostridium thermopalmarium]PRR76625.1 hypothetical protein CPAL_02960 [Clostridium thermopalmarium DSM 5974]PVZ28262.1 hypothetical protein LX19_00233 [Clostridium thermopalmarium DSM 5974]
MRFEITHEAEQYIKNNGNSAMVLLGNITGCCGGGGGMVIPEIDLRTSKDLSGYDQIIIGDINIFVDKRIDSKKKIEISLGKFLWIKSLSVELV